MYFEIGDYNALRAALHSMCTDLEGENVPEETVFDSRLVANELLTNVLQHGGGFAYFRAERQGDMIKLCVRSENAYRPPERSTLAPTTAESGRGLYLVDRFCVRRDYTEPEGIRVFIKIEK